MTRRVLIAAFAVCSLLAAPRPAFAGFWAWLQELSGPGPFKAHTAPVLSANCFPVPVKSELKSLKLSLGHLKQSPRDVAHCIFIDFGSFEAEADSARAFPAIGAKSFDVGGALRIANGFDIGAGIGSLSFKNLDTKVGKTRMTITPIRVVTRPLLLALPESMHKRWMGVLNVYWKDTYIKPLDGTYFGLDSTAFQSKGEMLQSFGVILDFTHFIRQ